jgi:hypothetical protein
MGLLTAELRPRQPNASLAELYSELRGGNEDERAEAKRKVMEAFKATFADALKAWFFRMYGTRTGVGQTFHEKSAASGFFANPLTVRVGGNAGTTYNQLQTRRFALLSKVALTAPIDYRENENVVRPAVEARTGRTGLADHITAARDEREARSRLEVRDADLPAIPRDPAGYLYALDRIRQACTDKRNRMRFHQDRKAELAETVRVAAEIREAVDGQDKYYKEHLPTP